jgi:ribonuclease P protein component
MISYRLQGFPKSLRILSKKDFENLRKDSSKVIRYPIVCFFKPTISEHGVSRIAFSISKKIGKANLRNRYKRLLRESFRKDELALSKKFDFLLVVSRRPESEQKLTQAYREIINSL